MNEKEPKKTTANFDGDVLAIYLHELKRIPLLSKEEEEATARAAAGGDKAAREKLVQGNLRFVINIAKKYQGKGLPIADLISEGNIGLMMAADRFDADTGYRFISYAVWWIRQSILKALNDKARMIRLPQNRANELLQIERARSIIQEQKNIKDEIVEIARFLEMDTGAVRDLIDISREVISLEVPIYSTAGNSILRDLIEDKGHDTPEQKAIRSIMVDEIETVLETLNDKEAEVIRYRYGIGSHPVMTLKEIGMRYNLTKERIRQIENKALYRLQHPAHTKKLRPYVA
jgi:RNA polymerase primary sigma factor